jgi:hypothetical protein
MSSVMVALLARGLVQQEYTTGPRNDERFRWTAGPSVLLW